MSENIKKRSEEILNPDSVDYIISSLKNINNRINSLITRSSDDFLFLHAGFTKIHELIRNITSDASGIIDSFTDKKCDDYINECTGRLRDLGTVAGEVLPLTGEINGIYEEIGKNLDHLFIPFSNCGQDIITFRFLSAGLKLNPGSVKNTTELDQVVEDFTSVFPDLMKQVKSFYNQLKISKEALDALNKSELKGLTKQIHDLTSVFTLLRQKTKNLSQLENILQEKKKRCIENSSKIITNLQYQDIVKQKIEHIQQNHDAILKRLLEVRDTQGPETKKSILLQVRDISGLQAAQLIYANKEYQEALEIITGKYLEQVDLARDISDLCRRNCFDHSDKLSFDPEMIKEKYVLLLKTLKRVRSMIFENMDSISVRISSFLSVYNELQMASQKLALAVSETKARIEHQKEQEHQAIKQFEEVSGEWTKAIFKIEKYWKRILSLVNSFGEMKERVLPLKKWEDELLHEINENNGDFENLLQNLKSLFTKEKEENSKYTVSEDILNSVQHIRYYDLFKKEISEIIDELNTLAGTINYDDVRQGNDAFEMVKQRYTIETEHMVHDHVEKEIKKGKGNMTDDYSVPNDNENNIEFF